MIETEVVLRPNETQRLVLPRCFSQSFETRQQFYFDFHEAKALQESFDFDAWVREWTEESIERFPEATINRNIYEASAKMVSLSLVSVYGRFACWSSGLLCGTNGINVPLFRKIETKDTIPPPFAYSELSYLVIRQDGEEFIGWLLKEEEEAKKQ